MANINTEYTDLKQRAETRNWPKVKCWLHLIWEQRRKGKVSLLQLSLGNWVTFENIFVIEELTSETFEIKVRTDAALTADQISNQLQFVIAAVRVCCWEWSITWSALFQIVTSISEILKCCDWIPGVNSSSSSPVSSWRGAASGELSSASWSSRASHFRCVKLKVGN